MAKVKLFVDMDGVVLQSVETVCRIYNMLYKHHPKFIPANPNLVKTWSMKEAIPLCDNIEDLFENELFFMFVEMMPNAKEVLLELNDKYDIHIISIGTLTNVAQKALYIKNELPFIKNVILLSNQGCKMGKDKIVMDEGIMIDDHQANLTNPTCSLPICFGKKFQWNSDFMGIRCETWDDVRKLLLD